MNTNDCLNSIFPAFNSLNHKFSPGSCLIDNFPDYFSFYLASCKNANIKTTYCNELKKLYKKLSNNQNTILIISDISIINNITTSVSHIQREYEIITKTIHHTINVLFIEAELFVIRYGIYQVLQIQDISHIVIITNTIHITKYIFDLSIYPY